MRRRPPTAADPSWCSPMPAHSHTPRAVLRPQRSPPASARAGRTCSMVAVSSPRSGTGWLVDQRELRRKAAPNTCERGSMMAGQGAAGRRREVRAGHSGEPGAHAAGWPAGRRRAQHCTALHTPPSFLSPRAPLFTAASMLRCGPTDAKHTSSRSRPRTNNKNNKHKHTSTSTSTHTRKDSPCKSRRARTRWAASRQSRRWSRTRGAAGGTQARAVHAGMHQR